MNRFMKCVKDFACFAFEVFAVGNHVKLCKRLSTSIMKRQTNTKLKFRFLIAAIIAFRNYNPNSCYFYFDVLMY